MSKGLVAAVAFSMLLACTAHGRALDDYVNEVDPTFNYTYGNVTVEGNGWTAYMYLMYSLKWLRPEDTDAHIWWHQMAIIIPHGVNKSLDSALLYITGETNDRNQWDFPDLKDEGLKLAGALCYETKSPGAVVWQIPNQPIRFADDPYHSNRDGDAILGLTWWRYVHNTTDPTWIALFPMVKASVRALDVLNAVVPIHAPGMVNPNKFFVAGASKRGWTTWLVGAVDPRVIAIIPIVLCAVNVHAFAHRQWQFYGAWTFALEPMWQMNFTQDLDEPNTKKLFYEMDPWYYMDNLTMPKLAINAVGDEFQMPDDQRYWAHDMPGEMNLLMVQNAEHSMATGVLEVVQATSAFILAIQNGYARPNYTWSIDEATGNITVSTPVTPTKVKVWSGLSALGISEGKRDFRWAAINATPCPVSVFGACLRPIIWDESEPAVIGTNTFMASFAPPEGRWLGFFIEVQWANPYGKDFIFTSPVSVVPNTMAFPDCHGRQCRGGLC